MFRMALIFAVLAAFLSIVPQGAAGTIQVTLSSPDDLSNLTVEQLVTINATLSGLAVGNDFIFNLNTKYLFDSSLLQAVPDPSNSSGLTPGPILSGAQIAGFNSLSSFNSDNATGIFADATSFAINQNGLYYSFTLKAIAAGTGTISFDSTPEANQYASVTTGFNYAPLPSFDPLSVTIHAAVPEPASISLAFAGVVFGLGAAWARRKAHVTQRGK
jgi:hypothetical protein